MRALRQKAGSQRGASITFALRLFLVCAVISSVVIVAATAAAGRMSEQADMDERYYAVTAAARKLQTEIDAQVVTLDYTKGKESEATVKKSDNTAAGKILEAASRGVLQKTETPVSVNNGQPIKNVDETVSCNITGNVKEDGTLVFDIIATTQKNSRQYALKLTFASDLKITASDSSQNTGKATVKWKLLGAEKVRNDRKPTTGG